MKMIEKLIRPEIRSFTPYNANQQPCRIKLDANESPFNMPYKARKELAEFIVNNPGLNLYPDTDATLLRQVIGAHWGADSEEIIVGTGSDQLIQLIASVFVGPGDKVLYPVPSFGMYRDSCIIAGGTPVKYILDPDTDYDYSKENIIEAYEKEKPKLIYICTPNNPTGNVMEKDEILEVARHCVNSVIVVDEAYAEFSGSTVIPCVKEFQNLLVLRTFSKAYGLAGIRCGYSVSGPKLAKAVNLARPPYNISSLSQLAGRLVLDNKAEIEENIGTLKKERRWLEAALSGINGIKVFHSSANFILIKVKNSRQVYAELCERGILVRAFGTSPYLEDCLRVSIGTHEQNSGLLDELSAICYNK